jgi:hypothetical protein
VDNDDVYFKYAYSETPRAESWSNSEACRKWKKYDVSRWLNFTKLGRATLKNDFTVSMNAIMCNSHHATLSWKWLKDAGRTGTTFTVHNTAFNPTISLWFGTVRVRSYNYHVNDYSTTHVFNSAWLTPVCRRFKNGTWIVWNIIIWNWGDSSNGQVFFRRGDTIKAITCIYNELWILVLSSDVVTKNTSVVSDDNPLDEWQIRELENIDNGRRTIDWLEFDWMGVDVRFGWDITNPAIDDFDNIFETQIPLRNPSVDPVENFKKVNIK